jgi:hypothetical protein
MKIASLRLRVLFKIENILLVLSATYFLYLYYSNYLLRHYIPSGDSQELGLALFYLKKYLFSGDFTKLSQFLTGPRDMFCSTLFYILFFPIFFLSGSNIILFQYILNLISLVVLVWSIYKISRFYVDDYAAKIITSFILNLTFLFSLSLVLTRDLPVFALVFLLIYQGLKFQAEGKNYFSFVLCLLLSLFIKPLLVILYLGLLFLVINIKNLKLPFRVIVLSALTLICGYINLNISSNILSISFALILSFYFRQYFLKEKLTSKTQLFFLFFIFFTLTFLLIATFKHQMIYYSAVTGQGTLLLNDVNRVSTLDFLIKLVKEVVSIPIILILFALHFQAFNFFSSIKNKKINLLLYPIFLFLQYLVILMFSSNKDFRFALFPILILYASSLIFIFYQFPKLKNYVLTFILIFIGFANFQKHNIVFSEDEHHRLPDLWHYHEFTPFIAESNYCSSFISTLSKQLSLKNKPIYFVESFDNNISIIEKSFLNSQKISLCAKHIDEAYDIFNLHKPELIRLLDSGVAHIPFFSIGYRSHKLTLVVQGVAGEKYLTKDHGMKTIKKFKHFDIDYSVFEYTNTHKSH